MVFISLLRLLACIDLITKCLPVCLNADAVHRVRQPGLLHKMQLASFRRGLIGFLIKFRLKSTRYLHAFHHILFDILLLLRQQGHIKTEPNAETPVLALLLYIVNQAVFWPDGPFGKIRAYAESQIARKEK